ncbi:MAG: c-type cytochrome [Bdellovibrionota bacterium]
MAVFIVVSFSGCFFNQPNSPEQRYIFIDDRVKFFSLPPGIEGEAIRYGAKLLANTAELLGPKSKIKLNLKSRMSCRNCHLGTGTLELGNSFLDTFQLYPQYRAREGRVQSLAERINLCFMHPMQGRPLDENSDEMKAIQMYLKWVGRGRPWLSKDPDARLPKVEFLARAANPTAGKRIYESYCTSCHGADGQGALALDEKSFKYPPLWGPESFISGSGMSRLSIMARFIKGNMPYMAEVKLNWEDSWDVAAFVMSQERSKWNGKESPFQNPREKPFDYPIPPYGDSFSEAQHKFGPFLPIVEFWKKTYATDSLAPSGI